MTALVPQAQTSAPDGAADLESTLKAIVRRKTTEAEAAQLPAKGSKPLPVKQETKDAVTRLQQGLSNINLPATRRELTQDEQKSLIAVGSDAKAVTNGLKKVLDGLRTAVFNHLDVTFEKGHDVDGVQVDASGHYVVEQEWPVEGTDKKFVRQVAEHAPTVTAASLKKLWLDNQISRATYYRLTKAVEVPREIDEEALLAALSTHPGLAEKLAPAIEPGKLVSSFWIKKVGEK